MNDSNNMNNNLSDNNINNQNDMNNSYNQSNNLNNNYNNMSNINNEYSQNNNFNVANLNSNNMNNGYSNQNNANYNEQVLNNQMINNNPINNMNNNYNQNISNNGYANQTNNYNEQPINNNINNEQKPNLMGAYTVPNNMTNNNLNQNNMNNNYGQSSNQMSYNNYSNDDELLKEFIGKNYDKITTRKFSFSGFFFSFGYMFYRKMFLYGLILSLIETIILNFVPNTIFSIISIVIMILCGLFVNKLYVAYAKKKIEKIKLENKNRDFTSLKAICSMNGGTSVGKVFLGILAEIGIAIVIGIVVVIIGFKNTANNFLTDLFKGFNSSSSNINNNDGNKDNDKNKDDSNKDKSNGENVNDYDGNFDGMIVYDSIEDIFYVNVPSIFEDKSNGFNMVEYTYEGSKGVFNECTFKIYSPAGYDDAESLIKGMAKYDKAKTVYNDFINNTAWYSYSFDDYFGKTERYGTNVGSKVYIIDLEVQDDADSSCKTYLNNMMNSVRKKY